MWFERERGREMTRTTKLFLTLSLLYTVFVCVFRIEIGERDSSSHHGLNHIIENIRRRERETKTNMTLFTFSPILFRERESIESMIAKITMREREETELF